MNSDQTTDTTQKPEHTYLKFLTLTVAKNVNLHGFNKFINQEM